MCLWLRIKPQTSYTAVSQQNVSFCVKTCVSRKKHLKSNRLCKKKKKNAQNETARLLYMCLFVLNLCIVGCNLLWPVFTDSVTLNLLKCTNTHIKNVAFYWSVYWINRSQLFSLSSKRQPPR